MSRLRSRRSKNRKTQIAGRCQGVQGFNKREVARQGIRAAEGLEAFPDLGLQRLRA